MYVPEILQNRTYLLTIIGLATTVAALGPFFVSEAFTMELAAHAILHVSAITFGVFLIILSVIAYNSTKNSNLIFTMLAFITFTVLSIFLLEEDLNTERVHHEESVCVDVLLTLMIGFFGIGVFANQKFKGRKDYN